MILQLVIKIPACTTMEDSTADAEDQYAINSSRMTPPYFVITTHTITRFGAIQAPNFFIILNDEASPGSYGS